MKSRALWQPSPRRIIPGQESRLIFNQRTHVVTLQLLSTRQKFQLNHKNESFDVAAQAFDQITDGFRSAARGKQVVRDDHSVAVTDRIAMNFQRVLTVLEII